MHSIEIQIATRRQIPKGIIETFNKQTCKDFNMKILTKHPQKWGVEDVDVDFELELIHQKLRYSFGTKYALCLARNELLTYAESDYILALDGFWTIPPHAIESLLPHLTENRIIQSIQNRHGAGEVWAGEKDVEWEGMETYDEKFERVSREGELKTLPPKSEIMEKLSARTGCMLFPMKTLEKVNGWNLAYDGRWGNGDLDLYMRTRNDEVKYTYLTSFKSLEFKHEPHNKLEKDEPIVEGLFLINRESGKKMDISDKLICVRANPTVEWKGWQDPRLRLPDGRCEYGLEQVRRLMK